MLNTGEVITEHNTEKLSLCLIIIRGASNQQRNASFQGN